MNLKNYCNIGFAQLFASSMSISDKFFFGSMLNKYCKIKMLSVFIISILFTIPISANDFYPSNVSPATGDEFAAGNPIPIKFDVCLGYDFPAAAGEWYVEIAIINSNSQVVHSETIPGFDANGPACYAINDAASSAPLVEGTYTLRIQTFYAQEINSENDLFTSEFIIEGGNDFYPSNISPANGAIFSKNSSIPIQFDVCLGNNYPANASEWYVNILIRDSDYQVVYEQNIQGFDANGPACFPINNAPDFIPLGDGTYFLRIETYYTKDINLENDKLTSEFVVKAFNDLALVSIISPPNMSELFYSSVFEWKVLLRNEGDEHVQFGTYSVVLEMRNPENDFFATIPIRLQDAIHNSPFSIAPGAEVVEKGVQFGNLDHLTPVNIPLDISVKLYFDDDNLANNTLDGYTFTFIPDPIFLNEFRTKNSLNKTLNNLTNNDFVECIVTDNFSNPELYSLMVYDSSGQQIDSTTMDLFTVGETVDSFTVYSYEFIGDVLPDNHGAIALSYDSLGFSDYFISWGGPITAVDGMWKDSTSTDIGITPAAGSSISLSGQGTDFSAFTWENSTPTPGLINDSQLVPVEEQPSLVNQFSLEQNYPNPFNPSTRISYQLPKASEVTIKIFNTLGQEIRTLINTFENPGYKSVIWNGKDNNSNSVTSGIYFYEIVAGDFRAIRKAVLLK